MKLREKRKMQGKKSEVHASQSPWHPCDTKTVGAEGKGKKAVGSTRKRNPEKNSTQRSEGTHSKGNK